MGVITFNRVLSPMWFGAITACVAACARGDLLTLPEISSDSREGDPASDDAVFAPVTLTDLSTPFPDVGQGQLAVPLIARFANASAGPVDLYGTDLLFSREASGFVWRTASSLPVSLPADSSTDVRIYLKIGATVALGDVEIEATAIVLDRASGRAYRIGPAPQPLVLHVGLPTDVIDNDRDGLSDDIELLIGTEPHEADTDADGLLDGVEAPDGVPVDADSDLLPDALDDDADGGGEADLLEWRRGSDPGSPVDDRIFLLLVVTDATDDLDGDPLTLADSGDAGPTLSFREALTIAANRRGLNRITFAEGLSGATIEITGVAPAPQESLLPELSAPDTFVDGSEDVTLHVDLVGKAEEIPLIRVTADRVNLRRLVFDVTPSAALTSSALPIVNFETAWLGSTVALSFRNYDTGMGSGLGRAILSHAAADLLVHLCDVRLGGGRGLASGLELWDANGTIVQHSVIETYGMAVYLDAISNGEVSYNQLRGANAPAVYLHGATNHVRIRENEITFSRGTGVISCNWACQDNQIDDNIIADAANSGIYIPDSGIRNSLRRNSITRCPGAAILLGAGAQNDVLPPEITVVQMDSVDGTHAGADDTLIDVYADPSDDALLYVGETRLQGNQWHLDFPFPIPAGYNLTATSTDLDGNTSRLSAPVAGP